MIDTQCVCACGVSLQKYNLCVRTMEFWRRIKARALQITRKPFKKSHQNHWDSGIVMKIPQVFFTYSVSPMRDAMLLASKYGIIKQMRSWSRVYPPTPICTITSPPTQLARNIAYAKYVDGLCSYLHHPFFVCGHDFPASLQLPGFKHKLRQVLKSANYDVVA